MYKLKIRIIISQIIETDKGHIKANCSAKEYFDLPAVHFIFYPFDSDIGGTDRNTNIEILIKR
jgi:hypothetical protein